MVGFLSTGPTRSPWSYNFVYCMLYEVITKRLARLREALLPLLARGYANPGAPELAARLGYIAARTGLLSPDEARVEYERIRNDADAPSYNFV